MEESKLKRKDNNNDDHYGIFSGIIFITIGIIFLLNNFGLLPWSVWSLLWRLWPLFLIFGGLEIILGKSFLSQLIIGLITTITMIFIFTQIMAISNSSFKNWMRNYFKWIPLNEKLFQDEFMPSRKRFYLNDFNNTL